VTEEAKASQKADWRRFVRKPQHALRRLYPCAQVTDQKICPRHGDTVGPVTKICKLCFDEFWRQMADEYSHCPPSGPRERP
jgi:hypothetical protein